MLTTNEISMGISAAFQIYDAKQLKIFARIRGSLNKFYPSLRSRLLSRVDHRMYSPKSLTIVHEHATMQPTKHRYISVGDRQIGDQLLFKTTKIIEKGHGWFAGADFQFDDDQKSITSVEFVFNVSI